MQAHVDKAANLQPEDGASDSTLPWSHEEELLVTRPVMQSDRGVTRNAIMFMVMTSAAFGMVRSALAPRSATSKASGCEKYLV